MAIPVNDYGERIAATGAVIVGPNQFALLAALFRMPEYMARSSRDLCRAALSYSRTSRIRALEASSRRMPGAWVTAEYAGRCLTWRLTPRGIGMMEGTVPIHIYGVGPYEGIAALRERGAITADTSCEILPETGAVRVGPDLTIPVRAGGEDDTTAGVVKLSLDELALLAGLFDRPDYLAESTADLCRAAVPYSMMFHLTSRISELQAACDGLLPAWVTYARGIRRSTWFLTPMGIAMIEGTVPMHIDGVGPYTGIAALRDRYIWKNRAASVTYRWGLARADKRRATLVREVDDLIERWCHRNAHRMQKRPYLRDAPRVLQYYARWYALRHGEVPKGRHILTTKTHGCDLQFIL